LGWKLNLLFQSFTIGARLLGNGQPGQGNKRISAVFREKPPKNPNSIVLFMFSNGFLQVINWSSMFFVGGKCQGFQPCGSLLVARAG